MPKALRSIFTPENNEEFLSHYMVRESDSLGKRDDSLYIMLKSICNSQRFLNPNVLISYPGLSHNYCLVAMK